MGALSPPAHARYPVRMEEDAGAARRAVGRLAGAAGVRRGDVEVVATELATNIIRHAGGDGYLLCEAGPGWLELLAADHGPGLGGGGLGDAGLGGAGLGGAWSGGGGLGGAGPGDTGPGGAGDAGASTPPRGPARGAPPDRPGPATEAPDRPGPARGSPGLGMGIAAVRRLADDFDFYSGRGGMVMLAAFGERHREWARVARWGAVNVPMGGTGESGDGWAVTAHGVLAAVVVDGLGHGPGAAAAAAAALEAFGRERGTDPGDLLAPAHRAMRQTRGGVLWSCVIDPAREELAFAGVGNVAGRLLHGGRSHGLAGRDGTVGTQLEVPKARTERHPWPPGATLVVTTDGVSGRWSADSYPGLFAHDPAVAAAVLYRDHGKGTDDATVLVVNDLRRRGQ